MNEPCLLALDFGGTKLSAAIAPIHAEGLNWLAHERHYSPANADAAYEQEAMINLAQQVLQGRQPAAIGVSFGGPVDYHAGLVRLSHHVAGWEETPLASLLTGTFGAPTFVDNDANVAALGEHHFGAGIGCNTLLYVTISTGVGSGWILDGRPWRGHEGMAGEIGHTVADPHGPLCLCGKRGCVERLASGPYMAADTVARLAEQPGEKTILRDLMRSGGQITGQDVAEAAALGDALARDVLLRGARALGIGLGNAANLINPERFILGGGVTKSGPEWWATVRETAQATALPEVSFDIVPAALGDDAPLWGAVTLAQHAWEQGAS
ncbi:MAG: ROK family protein [Chloroflexota bacterium]